MSPNYELSEALGDPFPREVSKTYRYDKYGNITKLLEINQYAQGTGNKTQLTINRYGTRNRIIGKRVCSDLLKDPDCNDVLVHVEEYRYDRMGRVQDVLDKNSNTIVQNHYNFIGQPSAQGLGGDVFSGTGNSLLAKTTRHVRGWIKSNSVRQRNGVSMFHATYTYDGGFPSARFDGSQSFATYAYGPGTPLGVIQYGYEYDDMSRLVSSTIGSGSTIFNASSTYGYFDDGRISSMTRDTNTGDYFYDASGRLKEIKGDLVDGRDMSMATHGAFVFDYDANGNLVADYSKQKDSQQPLEIFYRSDNLPYMFTYKRPRSYAGFDEFSVYMAYDDAGARVMKSTFKNNVWESNKNYTSTAKEIREAMPDGNFSSLEIYEMAGIGRATYAQIKPEGYKEYYIRDQLGTTREVFDFTTGALTFASHYYPYGKQFSEFNSNSKGDMRMSIEKVTQKFTGKELDEGVDLNYFGARYYDQDIGLWISPDAARQFSSLYAYGPNPVNGTDPDGNCFSNWPCVGVIEKSRQTHWNRNQHNKVPNTVDVALFKRDESGNYAGTILSEWASIYHMGGKDGDLNLKIVFKDGSEGVYNGETGALVQDPENMGTYNFINADVSGFGHWFMDMVPYWAWGNTPEDKTNVLNRIYPAGKAIEMARQSKVEVGTPKVEKEKE